MLARNLGINTKLNALDVLATVEIRFNGVLNFYYEVQSF